MSEIKVGFRSPIPSATTVQLPSQSNQRWMYIHHFPDVDDIKKYYPGNMAVITAGKITPAHFVYAKDYPQLEVKLDPSMGNSVEYARGLKCLLPYMAACVDYRVNGVRETHSSFIQHYQDIFTSEVAANYRLYAVEVGSHIVNFCYINADNAIARVQLSQLKYPLRISLADEPDVPWVEVKAVADGKNSIMIKQAMGKPILESCTLYVEADPRTGDTIFTREYPCSVAEDIGCLNKLLAYNEIFAGFYL